MASPFQRRAPLLVLCVVLGGLGFASGANGADDDTTSQAPEAVIIELTDPPSAAVPKTAALAQSAGLQRARVRRDILQLEGQGRAARGLSTAQLAKVLRHEYRVVANGFAADLLPDTIRRLASHPDVKRIVPDGRAEAILDVSVPHIRAPEVWSDLGYRGAGTTIAIIDTGVDYNHADLGGCFGAGCKVIGGYDFINDDADPMDDQGHGTHVAATAAGDGTLVGVAPDANILAYKVLNSSGSGPFSTIIAGIERATDPDDDGDPSDHVTVISMSLGGGGDENDVMSSAVDVATAAGVLSVISAGNSARHFTIGSPGTARTALTVGATDDLDQIAGFSSRGPTIVDGLLKPEITAPGVAICAARLPGAWEDRQCLDAQHAQLNGTSMAAPHVSGAAALLRGFVPSLTPAEAKAILQEAAVPLPFDVTTAGAGRVDARAALDVTTVLSPAPVNLGIDDGTQPTWSRTVTMTVRNLSAAARTYTLTVDGSGLPAGVTTQIVPDVVAVPADGSADVSLTLTADNALVPPSDAAPYVHTAKLVASAPPAEQQAVLVSFVVRPPLANDLCGNATALGAGSFGANAFAMVATTSADDPVVSCGCPGGNTASIWYRVAPTKSGTLSIDATNSDYPTVLGVFSGTCGSLHTLDCYDPSEGGPRRLDVEVKAGNTYYVEVSSFCGYPAGRLDMEIAVPGAVAATIEPLTEIFQVNQNDLAGTKLVFTPDGPSYSVCLEFAQSYPTDPAGGVPLALTGDSFAEVPLSGGQTVALYGTQYDEVFVGSNGYVTFTAGNTGSDTASHFDLPGIAPFSADYLVGPLNLGEVSWKQTADRFAVTWDGIQSFEPFEFVAYPLNRTQLELFFDGRIDMTFLETGWHGTTGLSAGGGAPELFPASNFLAVPHCRAPAGGEVPLGGQSMTFKDKVGNPDATKFKIKLLAPDPALLPQAGSAADPTLAGATLEIFSPRTQEFFTAPLPAAGWTALYAVGGGTAYAYRDRDGIFGPCASVELNDRRVRAKCSGAAFGFTLNEFGQYKLATSITFGSTSAGRRFCSVFGGKIKKDLPHAFVAKKAPTPDRCWLPESYYP